MAGTASNMIQRTSIIISVFSTSPGIGKTVIAINLAAGLANEGYKVCLADLDLQFGDVLNYLKLNSSNTVAGAQRAYLDNPENFRIENFLTEYRIGKLEFSILPAPRFIYDAYQTDVQILTSIIKQMDYYDFIILDLNSMFSSLNLAMLDMSTIINYIGVIDFLPALKNYKIGYDTLLRFEYEESKIRLIENRADSQKLIEGKDVERLLGEPFYHRFPNDFPAVNKSINAGQPLMFAAPDSRLTESFYNLVGRYTNRQSTVKPEIKSNGGLFSTITKGIGKFFGF
ncbi:MAG: AAA family ATPase [Selenomonadaceae bacterium]|nr:AAA family ATPase [Selenomonadaceae bacterium]